MSMLLTKYGPQCERCRTYTNAPDQHRCPEDMRLTERTPDGHPQVWLLYSPEPFRIDSPEEREINLWVRRCSVYPTRERAIEALNERLGDNVAWRPYHPLFPELWIGIDRRGARWLMEAAPVDPLGAYR